MSHFDLQKNEFEAGVVLRPISDHLVVIPYANPETTESGLLIPETSVKPIRKALVVGVGPGLINDKGNRDPIPVEMYDKVLIGHYVGTEVKVDGQFVLLIRQDDVLAIFEKDPNEKLSDPPMIKFTGDEPLKSFVPMEEDPVKEAAKTE